jgi:chromosome segregation ATPase
MVKSFTFSADSFPLSYDVESFLKSRRVIYLDFGSSAYIRSDSIPAIMSELLLANSADLKKRDDAIAPKAELEKVSQEKAALGLKLNLMEAEVTSLRKQMSIIARDLEATRAENLLLISQKNASASIRPSEGSDRGLRESHERLLKEFQNLRGQSIEALASLKVLEEENEELREELDRLRPQRAPVEKRQG